MLNGIVEPLLTMNSSTNRLMSIMMNNGENNSNNEISSKRSSRKTTFSPDTIASPNSNNNNSSTNNDNRIKFIDMLVCGSCQQDFQLSDILKFIEHKGQCGNKENKHKIPYHFPQRRHRRKGNMGGGGGDDDDDESQQSGNSSESDSENNPRQPLSHKQTTSAKVPVDASANTFTGTGRSNICLLTYEYLSILGEPYNFECSQCGDVYSTGNRNAYGTFRSIITIHLYSVVSHPTLSTFTWSENVQKLSQ